MITDKFLTQPQPFHSKEAKPAFRASVTHSPYTVKSLGLNQSRYIITNNSSPDFDSNSNLSLIDYGVTPICGFYSGGGSPIGVNRSDRFAIKYSGFFHRGLNGSPTSLRFDAIGFGFIKVKINNEFIIGSDSSYQELNQHTYNIGNYTIHNNDLQWLPFEVLYFINTGEAGFSLLWSDDLENKRIPVSAGVVNRVASFISSDNLSDVISISSVSQNRSISDFSIDVPLVESGSSYPGYYYDKYTDRYYHTEIDGLYLRKFDLMEVYTGYTEKNRVLSFSGDPALCYINGQNASSLNFNTTDHLIEAWIQHDADSINSDRVILNKKVNDSDSGYVLKINDEGYLDFTLYKAGTGESIKVRSSQLISGTDWHHIGVQVGLNNASGVRLYIDSQESSYSIYEDAQSVGSISNNHNFEIGSVLGVSGTYKGKIDDLRIWSFDGNIPTDIKDILFYHYYNPHKISPLISGSLISRWSFQQEEDIRVEFPNNVFIDSVGTNNLIRSGTGLSLIQEPVRSDVIFSEYGKTIKSLIGHIDSFEINRSNTDIDTLSVNCVGFDNLLKTSLNSNYPDKFDYWNAGFGGVEFSAASPDGVDYPTTFDQWPLEEAYKSLLTRGFIDPTLFLKHKLHFNVSGTAVSGTYLIERSTPPVVLDRARNYGNPTIGIVSVDRGEEGNINAQVPDDEYIIKSNYGDTLFDYINKIIEPYGWDWGSKPFYDGAFYLRTRNNPTEIVGSKSLDYSSSELIWSPEIDLDAISGTLRLTSGTNEYVDYTFFGQRIDAVLALSNIRAGGYGYIAEGLSDKTFTVQDLEGDNTLVQDARILIDMPDGMVDRVITDVAGGVYTLDASLSSIPPSGTVIRNAVARYDIVRGNSFNTSEFPIVASGYLPSYYPIGFDDHFITETINEIQGRFNFSVDRVLSGTRRYYYHGFDSTNGENPTQFMLGNSLTRDEHTLRINRISDAEAGTGTEIRVNALFIYDEDRNVPVEVFYTGDSLASGTITELKVFNNTNDIRNDVIVVGRRIGNEVPDGEVSVPPTNPNNPTSRFFITRAVDINSIINKDSLNFAGRPLQTILIDPDIASQDRTDHWAVQFMNRFRIPGRDASFKSIANPLIEVGDAVYVIDSKKDTIHFDNLVYIESIKRDISNNSFIDSYETTTFKPWESFTPKSEVDLQADFEGQAFSNISITPYTTPENAYDPYSSDEDGTLIKIKFDLNVTGFVRVEILSHNGQLITDLLNPTGEEGKKGFLFDTAGSNKLVTWDGVDSVGAWNEQNFGETPFNQQYDNWFVVEDFDLKDSNGDNYGKFYVRFTVQDNNGDIYQTISKDLLNENYKYIYTRRGEPIEINVTSNPVSIFPFGVSFDNPVSVRGFNNSDNNGSGLNLIIDVLNNKVRPAKATVKYDYLGVGYVTDISVPNPNSSGVTLGTLDLYKSLASPIIEREEFIDYSKYNSISFNGRKSNFVCGDFGSLFNKSLEDLSAAVPIGILSRAYIGHYFLFTIYLTDKSGRTSIDSIRTIWSGNDNFVNAVYPFSPLQLRVKVSNVDFGYFVGLQIANLSNNNVDYIKDSNCDDI